MLNRIPTPDVAILGYGCRLPGAPDPEAFWRVLTDRRCMIGEIGPDRWSQAAFLNRDRGALGSTYTAAAATLDDVFDFDAAFFGVSPREAAQLDPQQRLLLQVAWEAVELAGLTPARLAGPRTGVFVGASGLDYGNVAGAADPAAADAHFMTGNTLSIIANRVAHFFDAQGPSYVVDTACSSSLFAFHAACQAIRSGEIDVAIVGGVNLLLSPMPFIGFSRAGMLSPTGLCRPFAAGADGYVRGEGAVAFVLSGLAEARVAGDRVRGVVVGSAINSDGKANALSVPCGARQAALMRAVYGAADVSVDDLAFVEAHGTGTAVGDPIEARAIGEALAVNRAAPLPVGSAKSNVGHLEPASGLVGLLKAQLALERGLIPASLHIDALNPAIPFGALNLSPAREPAPIPRRDRPWAAGVNSFGFGGANAHVAIRQPTAEEAAPAPELPAPAAPGPLILSAATEEALKALAGRWRERLRAADPAETAALVAAAAHRRARLPRRLVVAETAAAARIDALAAFVEGRDAGRWAAETAVSAAPAPVAFVFAGNGSQWPGMGLAAYGADAAFRDSFDETAALVAAEGGPDLEAELRGPELGDRLSQAMIAQTLLLAIQIATVDALAARGVAPAAVAGHSVGEVAAAWAAGAITRADAAALCVRRARRQAPLLGTGGMAAVLAPVEGVERLIADAGAEGVAVAADNSPRGATVSGPVAAIEALIARARLDRIAVRRLRVEYPFHGPMMERIREGLLADLADLRPTATRIPFVSTTTGAVEPGETLDAGYWWRNARQPVLFRQAALALSGLGAQLFLEIGPQPSLQNYVADTLAPTGAAFAVVPSLRRQGRSAEDFDVIAARVAAAGGAVDDERLFGPAAPHLATPPAYPWSQRRHRIELTADRLNVNRDPAPRGLLGARARPGEGAWRVSVDPATPAWLADHRVDGAVVAPAAALAELALAAAAEQWGEGPVELRDFDILRAVSVEPGARVEIRTTLDPHSGVVRVESRRRFADGEWALNAAGVVRRGTGRPAAVDPPPAEAQAAPVAAEPLLYDRLAAAGLAYGPAFRRLGALSVDAAGRLAQGALAPSALDPAEGWRLDPTALDAAFHALAPLVPALRPDRADDGLCYLPVRIGRLTLAAPGRAPTRVEARLGRIGARTVEAAFTLRDAAGEVVAQVEGARFGALRLRRRPDPASLFWRTTLQPLRTQPRAPSATPGAWADPVGRLEALGLAAPAAPEPDACALLLDAACRRIAWDAARRIAPEGGVRRAARGALPPGLRAALGVGLAALAEDGAYEPGADRAALAPPTEPLARIVEALTIEAPERAAELGDLLRLAAAFDAAEPPAPRRDFGDPADDLWRALGRAADDMIDRWPADRPLAALAIGAPPHVLTERLRRRPVARLAVVAPGDDEALRAALAAGAVDLVLAADSLGALDPAALRRVAAAMAPGATLLAIEPQADLLRDMLAAAGSDGEAGPARREAGWVERLFAAGLTEARTAPYADPARPAAFVVARAPGRAEAPPARAPGRIALVGGDAALAAALATRLETEGRRVLRDATPASITPEDEVAILPPAGEPGAEAEAAVLRVGALRDLLAACRPARVWLLTRGALVGEARPVEAAVARVARTLANERRGLDVRVLDADPALRPTAAAARFAAALAAGPGDETEIGLMATAVTAPRVEPAPDVADRARRSACGPEAGWRLEADATGGLETLRWRPAPRRAPGPGEIEIAVAATGLNFRDVMWAMGVLPEEAIEEGFAGVGLGMECAGVVARAGAGARFREGDRVMAFAAGSFASHVCVADRFAAAAPAGLGFAAAAASPVVFGTAWRGLVDLGRLEAGETVLIHGGAGGVGLAALQIARARGARVIATAGSPEKRALLRMLGADAVFDSRTLEFADAVVAATGGRGVDVAVNSLSGEAMERTLDCLAPFGRFVELGKRDFYANTRIGMRPLRRNVAYFGVDLDAMLAARPDCARPLLEALAERVAAGEFAPPPVQGFAAEDAVAAFRLMQRAGHLGKIVVAPRADEAGSGAGAPPVRAEAAYLVTGGARGFGLAFAERLVERGARRLWLTSLSGALDPEAAAAVTRLRAAGAQVEAVACDAADEAAMRRLLARIDASGAPLAGVAHAAMRLDDALFENADDARLAAALRPKLGGAVVLDRLTRGRGLDFFVLFSSVAALFGNPGQSAYVAANAALERIAAARRAAGEAALAVGFGPIADAGVLAGDAQAQALLERRGAGLMTAAQALDALWMALAGAGPDDAALAVAPMRWGALAPELPILSRPLFERVDTVSGAVAPTGDARDVRALIEGLDEAAAVRAIADLLRAEAAIILRLPPEDVDVSRPMPEIGFDSLMGVELKLSLEEKYGLTLTAAALADGATIAALAARVAGDLRGRPAAAGGAAEAAALAARHIGGDAGAATVERLAELAAAGAAERVE